MKISTRVRYAARALGELAQHWRDGTPLKLSEIAKRQGISKKYLEQLFLPLKAAGVIVSVRGPAGGYKLAKNPKDLTFFKLTKILEGSVWLLDCLQSENVCSRFKSCRARKIWYKVNEALHSALKFTTVADLIANDKTEVKHEDRRRTAKSNR